MEDERRGAREWKEEGLTVLGKGYVGTGSSAES